MKIAAVVGIIRLIIDSNTDVNIFKVRAVPGACDNWCRLYNGLTLPSHPQPNIANYLKRNKYRFLYIFNKHACLSNHNVAISYMLLYFG